MLTETMFYIYTTTLPLGTAADNIHKRITNNTVLWMCKQTCTCHSVKVSWCLHSHKHGDNKNIYSESPVNMFTGSTFIWHFFLCTLFVSLALLKCDLLPLLFGPHILNGHYIVTQDDSQIIKLFWGHFFFYPHIELRRFELFENCLINIQQGKRKYQRK